MTQDLHAEEDSINRPQFDAVADLGRGITAEIAASNDSGEVLRLTEQRHGVWLALAEIARTRYVLEPAKFGAHWWDVADTWTGWGERGYLRGQTRDTDLAAAEAHARQLNDDAAAAVIAEATR